MIQRPRTYAMWAAFIVVAVATTWLFGLGAFTYGVLAIAGASCVVVLCSIVAMFVVDDKTCIRIIGLAALIVAETMFSFVAVKLIGGD
jgi:hypothetical protein